MRPHSLTIEQLIALIMPPNREICLRILQENRALFECVYGSRSNHHAWKGGYIDHVTEVMNFAVLLYSWLESIGRGLPFTLSDALLVLFLHDLEKPWKYEFDQDGVLRVKQALLDKTAMRAFRDQKLREYGIQLTPQHENGLEYVEGEHDYNPNQRMMGELAAFCHMTDVWSARGWHNYPLEENDAWLGAGRHCVTNKD